MARTCDALYILFVNEMYQYRDNEKKLYAENVCIVKGFYIK